MDQTPPTSQEDVAFTDIYVDDAIIERVESTLRSTRYVKGDRLETFEEKFAEMCDTEHAVGVSSGTAALLLALKATGIGRGDDVLVPAHTFFATASPIFAIGAKPVFVDVDPRDYTIDPDDFERKLEDASNPAAAIPVHLYGQPAEMDSIRSLSEEYDLTVVEDACQAHAAEYGGQRVGSLGDVGCFSFYPSKNMTVAGDGGMLVTDSEEVARQARMLRNHGRDDDGIHQEMGLNYRLDEVNAAVGLEQLTHIVEWGRRRAAVAERYDELLAGVADVTVPSVRSNVHHVYHLYVIQAQDRDALRDHLADRGIETGVHYPQPLHRQPAIKKNIDEDEITGLDTAERVVGRILSLPMHPRLEDREIRYVADAIREFYEGGR